MIKLEGYDPNNIFLRMVSKFSGFRYSMTFQMLASLTPPIHDVEFTEGQKADINFENKYDLVGITSITSHANIAYDIADEFRRRGVAVVLGGYHPSALPEEAKQHADAVVIGEAEETWPQLIRDKEHGTLKPYYIPSRPVPPEKIPKLGKAFFNQKGVGIQATRGCPYSCDFCSISNMKYRRVFRKRPIEDVLDEIQRYVGKLFVFQDSSMTADPAYAKSLFKEMKGLNKKFLVQGNIHQLNNDEELLRLASEAGCILWSFGLESVCQASVDSVGKTTNRVEDYLVAIQKIHDCGAIVDVSFMFGLDYDTTDVFSETDEFVRRSEIDIPCGMVLTPYPGTPLYQRLEREHRILTKDWSKYTQQHVVFQPKQMTPEELLHNNQNINRRWFKMVPATMRALRSMKFGVYPFSEVFTSNIFWKLSH